MLATRMSHFPRVAVIVALLAVAACQTAPVQEMSDARQAISVAREADAQEHAAADLQAAIDYLRNAESLLSERKYDLARDEAVNAKSSALDALRRSENSADKESR